MAGPYRDKIAYRLCVWRRQLPGALRRLCWAALGMRIGRDTNVPRLWVTWPHQVSLGQGCRLEPGTAFKFDGPWRRGPSILIDNDVFIGRDCEFNIQQQIRVGAGSLVGSGCRFIDHDHSIASGKRIADQPCIGAPICIGADVWLGANVVVLKGVTIGEGAVIGAGSIVTKSVPAGEIWAGVPARYLRRRAVESSL